MRGTLSLSSAEERERGREILSSTEERESERNSLSSAEERERDEIGVGIDLADVDGDVAF